MFYITSHLADIYGLQVNVMIKKPFLPDLELTAKKTIFTINISFTSVGGNHILKRIHVQGQKSIRETSSCFSRLVRILQSVQENVLSFEQHFRQVFEDSFPGHKPKAYFLFRSPIAFYCLKFDAKDAQKFLLQFIYSS